MSIGTPSELDAVAAAGHVAARALRIMLDAVEPGITTAELNAMGAREIRRSGARSAPMLAAGFPAETCISVNDDIAHGIPGPRTLGSRDLVNIDVSVELDGFFADTGASVPVGAGSPELRRLCAAGRESLDRALGAVRTDAPLNAIGRAAERTARGHGYTMIRDLCGHGVGRALHEAPREVPCHFEPRDRRRLTDGLVLAIEPFVSTGARHVRTRRDGWTLATDDGGLAVQYEHTIVVTAEGALVLTAEEPYLA